MSNTLGIDPSHRLLLAVSGGIDSVAMVDLMAKRGRHFGIAHCNFQLRGDASNADMALVEHKAHTYQVPFFYENFDPQKLASDKGISLQMAAREQRYHWLEKIRATEGYDWIATAHHLDDQAETMLLNLIKGTGIKGLHGIPRKSGRTIRPLLFVEKEELRAYAKKSNLNWREDASNQKNDYQRNYLRSEVIPALKTINPSLNQTMEANAHRFSAMEAVWKSHIENLWHNIAIAKESRWELEKDQLLEFGYPKVYLYELLAPFGFNHTQVSDLYKGLKGEPGKLFYSPSHVLELGRKKVLLYPIVKSSRKFDHLAIESNQKQVEFEDLIINISFWEKADWDDRKNPFVACLDANLLQWPLILRYWEEGDFFYPLGMEHPKKLSDFFVDEKLSRHKKAQTLVVESGGNIVWIVGHRIDHRFRVTDSTKQIMKISADQA